jgi:hypothetical protein
MDNNSEEAGGGGAQLGSDDATSVAIANPTEDAGEVEIAEHVDNSVRQPSTGASTRGPKRTLDT